MTENAFKEFKHEAVHALMDLNEACEKKFGISAWPRWDYDLDAGTLTFSEEGVPRVVAQIQAVGTTSAISGTWLWAWANESIPPNMTQKLTAVRAFGLAEEIAELTEPSLPDDEYLGWEVTSLVARLTAAKGAYRCPNENGFLYVIYTEIQSVEDATLAHLNT